MPPAFELHQSVLRALDRLGLELKIEGRETVRLAHIPLPDGFSEPETEIRFDRRRDTFVPSVPARLEYNGRSEACRGALTGRLAGDWRALRLDLAACGTFEDAIRAALAGLESPAEEQLAPVTEAPAGPAAEDSKGSRRDRSALDRFATLLTPAIRDGQFPEIVAREDELDFIEDALVHRSPGPRVVLVVGDVGVGRWSTGAVGLSQRMISGRARCELAGRLTYLINPGSIVGGIMMVGELEQRIEQIATEAVAGGHVVFVPDNAIQVLRVLPPLHDLNVVARATRAEIEAWRVAAPNQVGPATLVLLRPMTTQETASVLEAHRDLLIRHYGLPRIDEGILKSAIALADESVPGALPGAAVRLLEQACAIASRRAQQGGDGLVTPDHLLAAISRLSGREAADLLLSRWFDRAVTGYGSSTPESLNRGAESPENPEEENDGAGTCR